MNEVPFTIRQCTCGAVTIVSNAGSISMTAKTFGKEFPGIGVTVGFPVWFSCNHCDNDWQVENDYYKLEPVKSFVLNWIFENIPCEPVNLTEVMTVGKMRVIINIQNMSQFLGKEIPFKILETKSLEALRLFQMDLLEKYNEKAEGLIDGN